MCVGLITGTTLCPLAPDKLRVPRAGLADHNIRSCCEGDFLMRELSVGKKVNGSMVMSQKKFDIIVPKALVWS